eukprot:TRINITY_DN1858_c0_g1_i1.p1 TRINITY_DN1858_c0_g1~~TRINITY_DN1858_c0_g1_i1.p1  ORF type:complete len:657 (+),score=126.72 TRINITY_DN1858_c0_g1_i1:89-1972(+)
MAAEPAVAAEAEAEAEAVAEAVAAVPPAAETPQAERALAPAVSAATEKLKSAVLEFTSKEGYEFGDVTRSVILRALQPRRGKKPKALMIGDDQLGRLRTGRPEHKGEAVQAVGAAVDRALQGYRAKLPVEWVPDTREAGDIKNAMRVFEADPVVAAVSAGPLVDVAQDGRAGLESCLSAEQRLFAEENKTKAYLLITEWRCFATEALSRAEGLQEALLVRKKEQELAEQRAAKRAAAKAARGRSASPEPKGTPEEMALVPALSDSGSEKEEKEALAKAAKGGFKKGLSRGLKVLGSRAKGGTETLPSQAGSAAAHLDPVPSGAAQQTTPTPSTAPAAAAPASGSTDHPAAAVSRATPGDTAGRLALVGAGAGLTSGVLAGVDALRHHWVRRKEDKVLKGKAQAEETPLIAGMVKPAAADAAVAGAAGGGTAVAVAAAAESTAFQAGGSLAVVGRHMGPAVTGVFCAVGTAAALRSWQRGKSTGRDLKKALSKMGWGAGTGLGCVAVAGAAALGPVALPAAAVVGIGVIALDLCGATDGALDKIFGQGARKLRVMLVKEYASVLHADPTASDEEIRECYTRLCALVDPANGWGGTERDLEAANLACARLLLLRGESRSQQPGEDGEQK